MLLLWIGGGALLYIDLRPLVEQILHAINTERGLGMELDQYLLSYARPVFVFGAICAAGLPERKKSKSKPKSKPAAPKPSTEKKG
jgi:hypothetical protein